MSVRVCVFPECAEPNPPDATHCHVCGRRLVEARLDARWRRVRAAIGDENAASIDPDKHADMIVNTITEREQS